MVADGHDRRDDRRRSHPRRERDSNARRSRPDLFKPLLSVQASIDWYGYVACDGSGRVRSTDEDAHRHGQRTSRGLRTRWWRWTRTPTGDDYSLLCEIETSPRCSRPLALTSASWALIRRDLRPSRPLHQALSSGWSNVCRLDLAPVDPRRTARQRQGAAPGHVRTGPAARDSQRAPAAGPLHQSDLLGVRGALVITDALAGFATGPDFGPRPATRPSGRWRASTPTHAAKMLAACAARPARKCLTCPETLVLGEYVPAPWAELEPLERNCRHHGARPLPVTEGCRRIGTPSFASIVTETSGDLLPNGSTDRRQQCGDQPGLRARNG